MTRQFIYLRQEVYLYLFFSLYVRIGFHFGCFTCLDLSLTILKTNTKLHFPLITLFRLKLVTSIDLINESVLPTSFNDKLKMRSKYSEQRLINTSGGDIGKQNKGLKGTSLHMTTQSTKQ